MVAVAVGVGVGVVVAVVVAVVVGVAVEIEVSMTSHLLDEALKHGAHFRCPEDGASFEQKVMTMTGRWAPYVGWWVHLNTELNQYHLARVGEERSG